MFADAHALANIAKLTGDSAGGLIHLINSGSTCLEGTGEITVDGKPGIKPFWDISEAEAEGEGCSTTLVV